MGIGPSGKEPLRGKEEEGRSCAGMFMRIEWLACCQCQQGVQGGQRGPSSDPPRNRAGQGNVGGDDGGAVETCVQEDPLHLKPDSLQLRIERWVKGRLHGHSTLERTRFALVRSQRLSRFRPLCLHTFSEAREARCLAGIVDSCARFLVHSLEARVRHGTMMQRARASDPW